MIMNMVEKSSFLTLTMYYNQLDWEVFTFASSFSRDKIANNEHDKITPNTFLSMAWKPL